MRGRREGEEREEVDVDEGEEGEDDVGGWDHAAGGEDDDGGESVELAEGEEAAAEGWWVVGFG